MQFAKKLNAIVITLLLVSALVVSLIPQGICAYDSATQAAINEGMHWDLPYNASAIRLLMWYRYHDKVPTWVYGVLTPNPVGVGQRISIIMFNPQLPYQAQDTNDIRYEYKLEVTRPDGVKETLPASGTYKSDSTGTTFTFYTPTMTGNYTFNIIFQELYWRWDFSGARDYYGVTLLSSNRTYVITVQEEPVYPTAVRAYPLPTEYWTRPIEGQNDAWGAISSNWLNSAHDKDYGSTQNRFQTEGIGPETGHILWTKPTEDGGVVGGDQYFSSPGEVFNAGHQYQTRFQTQIIMHGRLLYEEPIYWAGTGGDWVCVDLRTGEEVWRNDTMSVRPSFGYYYDWDTMNDHGVMPPGWIFAEVNMGTAQNPNYYWIPIHPRYGTTAPFNITNVPQGPSVIGPKGEVLRYIIRNDGTSANPNWRLYQWNSSKVLQSQTSGIRNASLDALVQYQTTAPNVPPINTWDFNVSLGVSFTTAPTIRGLVYGDVLLGSNGTLPTAGTGAVTYHNVEKSTLWAISLKKGEEGRLLWIKEFTMTKNDGSQYIFIRAGDGVFIMQHMPTLTFIAYDMHTGEKLWESEPQADFNPFGYFTWVSLMNVYGNAIAYGKFFTTGYTGAVFCYDLYNGTLLWKQEAPTGGEIFKYYTLFHGVTADRKIYIGTHEHSADTPLLKGAKVRCFDVDTGEEVWSMMGWAHPGTMAIADGILIYWNNYDHKVYSVGKGPSEMTATITDDVVPFGQKVLVKGTVTDISPGTRQHEQASRFPNGVPAVADESMSAWMEYVYMQKPKPVDVKGVEVIVEVLDPNGNYYEVGRTTSDANGFFSLAFDPPVPGKYTVIARFAGSKSYWPSHAETAVFVEETPPAPATPTPQAQAPIETYFAISTIAIIAVIVIIGVLLLRKRP
jgi:outer membrane protein assembly factor BamB